MFFDDWFLDPFDLFEDEEVKEKRKEYIEKWKEYLEAKRRARERWWEERRKELSTTAIVPYAWNFPLETEEGFRQAVEEYAKAHKDEEVKAYSINFPGGYYRSISITKKKEE